MTRRANNNDNKPGEPSRAKRIKPIPPPLDLNARTLSPQVFIILVWLNIIMTITIII